MGSDERADAAVIQSSIALLQERFRQLQKVKEMREERELLRFLSEPKTLNFNSCFIYEQPAVASFFFHSDQLMNTPPQTSLSLWPTSPSQTKYSSYCGGGNGGIAVHAPPLMNLWPANLSDSCSLLTKVDVDSDSDIDTSLHL